jgi:hypothetical protein
MAIQGWRPQQVDVKSAYLYGDLDEEIFMTLSEGHREKAKTVRLRKYIYGFTQSGRKWYERLTKHFESSGFAISNFDPYVLVHKSEPFFIAVYVDDITLYRHPGPMMKHVKKPLKSEFDVTDLGDLHWLLGIQIKFGKKGIELSQSAYIDTILLRFGMTDCNPTVLPIDRNTTLKRLMPDEVVKDIQVYQSMIGSIMYLVTGTRPDLTFAISCLSQFSFAPNKSHVAAVKRCLRYIKGTRNLALVFPSHDDFYVAGFSNSDYGNCVDTRRSVSGYIFRLGLSTISWRSQKQKSVSTSTTVPEYVALSKAATHFIWLKTALADLGFPGTPMAMFCDNRSTIDLAENHRISELSKHIDIHHHRVRELVHDRMLPLMYIPTTDNLADMCTKRLPEVQLSKLRDITMGKD